MANDETTADDRQRGAIFTAVTPAGKSVTLEFRNGQLLAPHFTEAQGSCRSLVNIFSHYDPRDILANLAGYRFGAFLIVWVDGAWEIRVGVLTLCYIPSFYWR
jgi:hypothetical protein